MKTKIEIKNRWTGKILFEFETESNSTKQTLEEAVRKGAYLNGAYLTGADLTGAYLKGAYLNGADLNGAYLKGAYLTGAYLNGAYLTGADLTGAYLKGAYLTHIKNDFFALLIYAIVEIPNLKKAIIEGRINGSVYEGKCACLFGTLEKTNDANLKQTIYDLRDSDRPIERFSMGINEGDTPETNQISKIILEWIEEFEGILSRQKMIAG